MVLGSSFERQRCLPAPKVRSRAPMGPGCMHQALRAKKTACPHSPGRWHDADAVLIKDSSKTAPNASKTDHLSLYIAPQV